MKHLEFTRVPTLPPIVEAVGADIGKRAVLNCFDTQHLDLDYACRPGSSLPLRDMIGLFERFARARGDYLFGVFAAKAIRPEVFGIFVTYAFQAPNMETAIVRTIKGVRLHQNGSTMTLRRDGPVAAWSYKVDLPLTLGRHHHAVHVLWQLYEALNAYLGYRPELLEVGLEAAAYGRSDAMEVLFAAPVRWSQATNYISFPSSLLSTARMEQGIDQEPVTFSDLLRYARSLPPRSDTEKAMSALRLCMASGDVSIDAVARYLNTGTRTLQRRLASENVTFHELLETMRRERAAAYITETTLPLKQIAQLLGYSDPAHFTRAYRRWHDRPPSSPRQMNRFY